MVPDGCDCEIELVQEVTVLWCYMRNSAFKTAEKDLHVAPDVTGQANRHVAEVTARRIGFSGRSPPALGVTIEAVINKRAGGMGLISGRNAFSGRWRKA